MKFLIVVAAKSDSFLHKLCASISDYLMTNSHEIRVVDLHKLKFHPVGGRKDFKKLKNPDFFDYQVEQKHSILDGMKNFDDSVREQLEHIKWCEFMMFFYPETCYTFPPILKGWYDRCYAYYFAYGGTNKLGKNAMYFCHNHRKLPKEEEIEYCEQTHQIQYFAGVTVYESFSFVKGNDETIKDCLTHIEQQLSTSNKIKKFFQFPKLKSVFNLVK